MITDRTMKIQVEVTLIDQRSYFDVDTIVDEIKAEFGLVNIDDVPSEKYWAIVEKHQVA